LAADVASDCPPRHADFRTDEVLAAATSFGRATPAVWLSIARAADRQLGLFDRWRRSLPFTMQVVPVTDMMQRVTNQPTCLFAEKVPEKEKRFCADPPEITALILSARCSTLVQAAVMNQK